MSEALQLPIIDLSSTDRISNANSIRQACMDHGFFYLVNHGVEEELVNKVFEQSKKFFSLPVEEKIKLASKDCRGYSPLYSENLDHSSNTKAKASYKESFYAGPPADGFNQWPSEDFFQKVDSVNEPCGYLALLHYPGDSDSSREEIHGASPHSDFGTITLLMIDGVPGLQICRDKTKQPQVWEDVPSLRGAFIVNIGDMMERWTNCLFRSTLHRVLSPKQERYSVVFFTNADKDCIIECLESCCNFPPFVAGTTWKSASDLHMAHSSKVMHCFSQIACLDHGFFYLVNHGVEEELIKKVFEQSKKFFSLPVEEKNKLSVKNHRGYTAMYFEKLDTSLSSKGDSKESFYIGPLRENHLNQWPSEEDLPSWRSTMEAYHEKLLSAGIKLLSLIALALNLDEDFFQKVGALNEPMPFMRLLHYPGDVDFSKEEVYGASAHSDYGMITLLLTDGVPGLQVCRDKSRRPQVWEDVPSISGALIVNIADLMERWTNCLFRSTLHRVVPTKQERYSVAFFMDPNKDCIVECLETCCSETCPPRFPPIRTAAYLEERFRVTAMTDTEDFLY
ncbi:Isopenicillin N synthase [Corchorus capsularis]|uniref:Isopenicillin N synthase n=1 Tax=Corchorus capsularis TaxID=210143 RepID=A0A1R3GND5_COCAP|nr:Isopenicillin N synthase [Corchorus capsularis]